MPVLKCIGGTNDGQYYEVGSLKIGEVFIIPKKHFIKVVGQRNISTNSNSRYNLRHLVFFEKETFSFLTPIEWTDKQAIEFQFAK